MSAFVSKFKCGEQPWQIILKNKYTHDDFHIKCPFNGDTKSYFRQQTDHCELMNWCWPHKHGCDDKLCGTVWRWGIDTAHFLQPLFFPLSIPCFPRAACPLPKRWNQVEPQLPQPPIVYRVPSQRACSTARQERRGETAESVQCKRWYMMCHVKAVTGDISFLWGRSCSDCNIEGIFLDRTLPTVM